MVDKEAQMEEEKNYHKIFFTMVEKVDKLFVEYENTIKPKKKEPNDYALVNHEGGRGDPLEPPSPSSSDISSSFASHHSNKNHRNASKKPFFKIDVKFYFPTYNGECNVEKLKNWIRHIKVYFQIQQIEEDEAKIYQS